MYISELFFHARVCCCYVDLCRKDISNVFIPIFTTVEFSQTCFLFTVLMCLSLVWSLWFICCRCQSLVSLSCFVYCWLSFNSSSFFVIILSVCIWLNVPLVCFFFILSFGGVLHICLTFRLLSSWLFLRYQWFTFRHISFAFYWLSYCIC